MSSEDTVATPEEFYEESPTTFIVTGSKSASVNTPLKSSTHPAIFRKFDGEVISKEEYEKKAGQQASMDYIKTME